MKNIKAMKWLGTMMAVLVLAVPTLAQNAELIAATQLYEDGEWEEAAVELGRLLQENQLSPKERTEARLTLAKTYINLKQDPQAVEAYKQIVRDNPSFDMRAFGVNAPAVFLKNFGQAVVELRNEEMQAREAQLSRTSRSTAFFRSTLVPGWGQYYQGYHSRGYAMLGLTGASIVYALIADRAHRTAQDDYNQAEQGAEFETLYRNFEDKSNQADLALGLVAGVWLFNMFDAGLQGPNITRSGSPLTLIPVDQGFGMQLAYRF